jgi:expansin (peptidoglycan-binding protein)
MQNRNPPKPHALYFGVALALCACGGGVSTDNPAQVPGLEPKLGVAQQGVATYYTATGAGACSYDPSPGNLMVAAINAAQYSNGQFCGMCVEVSGPKGTIIVRITDLCPGCAAGHLDLSKQAFVAIADKKLGVVGITWTPVACPVQGPIAIRFKKGSSQWRLSVQVRNSRLPIRQIEMKTPVGFVIMDQQKYNYAINADSPGPGPYSFRITAIDGQQLVETGVPLRKGSVVQGTQQFQ